MRSFCRKTCVHKIPRFGGGGADFIFMGARIFHFYHHHNNSEYHGVGNFYLINSKKLQIGIGIGKFSIINSEELHIGTFLGKEP